VVLSLLVLLSPDLTLAPIEAAPAAGNVTVDVPRLRPVAARPIRPSRTVEYQQALDAALVTGGADGVTFAVASRGRLTWTGSSGSHIDGRPLVAHDAMVIGSVTKTFVAAIVLQLVEEGQLRLDDRIGVLLPEHDGVDPEITLRQLLDHSSGVADIFNATTRIALEEEPGRAWGTNEVLATVGDAWHPPGDGWSYANTNYLLLGLVIERVTGRTLADEVAARISGPLGLASTELLSAAEPAPLTAAWATIFWASGATVSTAADLATWGDALYGGDVITPEARSEMLAFNDDDHGLGAQRLEMAGRIGVGHTGLLDTYTTILVHLPGDGVTVAMIVNRPRAPLEAMLNALPPDGGPSLLELAAGGR
jgi:D-alanyl-D-alanine carboxypeptidase